MTRMAMIRRWISEGHTIKWIALQQHVTANAIHQFLGRERRRENNRKEDRRRTKGDLGHSYSGMTEALRWEIMERDNFTCQGCGSRKYLNVDHIKPLVYGGETKKENLQTLCGSCNSRKAVS